VSIKSTQQYHTTLPRNTFDRSDARKKKIAGDESYKFQTKNIVGKGGVRGKKEGFNSLSKKNPKSRSPNIVEAEGEKKI